MLTIMVSVIEPSSAIHVEMHEALADVLVAALAAEPATAAELQLAAARFVDPAVIERTFSQTQPGAAVRSSAASQMVLDLPARMAFSDQPLAEFPRLGNVQSCDHSETLDLWLPYRIPDDWYLGSAWRDWDARAKQRREQQVQQRLCDHRRVLYGDVSAWLVRQWYETCKDQQVADQQEHILRVQEEWLLTPREDLSGRTPRALLLEKRDFIDGDVQDQGQNWSQIGRCPPGLDPSSQAFRYGGYGSHEIILYHEMVEYLLVECERRLHGSHVVDLEKETVHLEQLQQEWLHMPHQSLYDQSPAAVIARERARLPAVVPSGHAPDHDDCPLCRMMMDSGSPMIWQLDNFAMDRTFATSFCKTLAEWEELKELWEDDDTNNGKPQDIPRPAEEDSMVRDEVWQQSHTNMAFFEAMPPLEACGVMLFSIGGHMAELLQDVRDAGESSELCRRLHEAFDDLRIIVRDREDAWMLRTAVITFEEVLKDVSESHHGLVAKCADLEDKLDFLQERYQAHSDEDCESAT